MTEKNNRKTGKILAVAAICAAVAAGGIGVATAPGWANPAPQSEASSPVRNEPGLAAPVVKAVELGVTPLDGAKGVNPAVAPSVKAVNGRVKDVVLAPTAGGDAVKGTVSADGSTWTALDPLQFNTPYSYSFTIVDGAGRETKKAQTFTTVEPANEADAAVYPENGSTVARGSPSTSSSANQSPTRRRWKRPSRSLFPPSSQSPGTGTRTRRCASAPKSSGRPTPGSAWT